MADDKRINVAVDPDLHCRVKREAKKVRRTVQQTVRDLILRGLGKDPDAPKAVKP
jgi:hypothetical protein